MKLAVILTVVAVLGAVVLGAGASPAAAAKPDIPPSVSSNWAGYAISDSATIAGAASTDQPLAFSDVTATWVQPKASCKGSGSAFSAFWVGLGGFATTSTALEQVGTESDCADGGRPAYFAWYEIIPAPSVRIDLKIQAGDTITAAVVVNGSDVLLQVKDRTRGTKFTRHLTVAEPDVSSAEWIAEAPSECGAGCHVLPLANFGSVAFSRIAAVANGHPGTLTDPTWTALPIQLVPRSGSHSFFGAPDNASKAGANPGSTSADGRTFSVSWLAEAVVP